jgi:hypothetical protein
LRLVHIDKMIKVGNDVSLHFRSGSSQTIGLTYDLRVGDRGCDGPSISASQRGCDNGSLLVGDG